MELKNQHIIRLSVSNIKRVSAVEIWPEDNTVIIGGENQQGKSSVLDSICYALSGGKSIPAQPVKIGKSHAEIVVELDDLIVTRKFSSKGTTLVVTARDGTPVSSPQTLLDKLTGALAFDPMAFSRMCESDPKKAVATLCELVKLDLTKFDSERKAAYDERTMVGRELENEKGKLLSLPHITGLPKEEISVEELTKELNAAREHNKQRTILVNNARTAAEQVDKANTQKAMLSIELDQVVDQITELNKKKNELETRIKNGCDVISGLESKAAQALSEAELFRLKDELPIIFKISESGELNTKVRQNKTRAATVKLVDEKTGKYEELTQKIAAIEDEKKKALENANFPVKEISFDESGVLVSGVPFVQGSSAEKIRVSLAIGIALNPNLRVMIIRDGSLMDAKSLQIVRQMAEASNTQVWIESVSTGDEVSVIIEDGSVKE